MKKIFLIISIFIILMGISMLIYNYYQDKKYQDIEKILLQDFFEDFDNSREEDLYVEESKKTEPLVQDTIPYLAVIEISNISLYTGVIMSNSSYTTMNRNVSVYPTSDMPNKENGNFILFAHSGNSRSSYFRNIHKLRNNDEIYIYYNNEKYTYRIIEKYEVSMYDNTPLNRMKDRTIITLITCKLGNDKYRTIVVGEMVK